jgi:hypothetical protein
VRHGSDRHHRRVSRQARVPRRVRAAVAKRRRGDPARRRLPAHGGAPVSR